MSTISKANIKTVNDAISQGDIFVDIKYSYINNENEDHVEIVEMEFPLAVVISQACDVAFMNEIQENEYGKCTKYMPSILLCPIYNKELFRETKHLNEIAEKNLLTLENEKFYTSDNKKITEQDMHYRFYSLEVKINNHNNLDIQNAVIDFKHYFSTPISYLLKNRNNRYCSLENIFAQQITLKFANYLSRVAIP